MNGTKNLSASGIEKVAAGLKLTPKENDYFGNLVLMNQAQTPIQREKYFARLSAVRPYSKTQRLREEQMEYLSMWYYGALRSLLPVIVQSWNEFRRFVASFMVVVRGDGGGKGEIRVDELVVEY